MRLIPWKQSHASITLSTISFIWMYPGWKSRNLSAWVHVRLYGFIVGQNPTPFRHCPQKSAEFRPISESNRDGTDVTNHRAQVLTVVINVQKFYRQDVFFLTCKNNNLLK
jgi:hypothetical protein